MKEFLFLVLDEATSQVSLAMEHVLYKQCHQLGITVTSVGHRDSLKQYHDSLLHLNGHGDWKIEDLKGDEDDCDETQM
jgi:ABC-type uncharacterized transport system fused permease/ATPase subunit